jgi:beta-carotene 3-hydroxylase
MKTFLLIAGSFFLMEFWAWFSHKYVMHGFLWTVHKDHHIKSNVRKSFFEKNDLFIFFFALPAMIMIIAGFATAMYDLVSIGAGFTLYGLTYFLLHDVLIHKRINHNISITGGYLGALVRAHWAHHAPGSPRDFRNFGLIIFPIRYFKH